MIPARARGNGSRLGTRDTARARGFESRTTDSVHPDFQCARCGEMGCVAETNIFSTPSNVPDSTGFKLRPMDDVDKVKAAIESGHTLLAEIMGETGLSRMEVHRALDALWARDQITIFPAAFQELPLPPGTG